MLFPTDAFCSHSARLLNSLGDFIDSLDGGRAVSGSWFESINTGSRSERLDRLGGSINATSTTSERFFDPSPEVVSDGPGRRRSGSKGKSTVEFDRDSDAAVAPSCSPC